MKRLVYAPKVWVYVKGRPGPDGKPLVYDVSDYVVSGTVERRVNQVSSAEINLRNPNRIFTQLGNPAFLPMDPITIFLQRHVDKPVRVFTGWIDESPYYQMYPGVCTIKASCTLKKLQYTFWDPALPFVMGFLKKLGWAVDVSNGLLVHPSTLLGGPVVKGDITKTQLTDGGFGALLFAIMNVVGGWDKNNIYIENLPPDLVKWVTGLFKTFKKEEDTVKKSFEGLLTSLIGTGNSGSSSGSGSSGSTGNTPPGATQANVRTVWCTAKKYGVPPEFVMATIDQECSWNPKETSSCCIGWFQINCCGNFDFSNPNAKCTCGGFAGSNITWTLGQTQDLGATCEEFCKIAAKNYPSLANQEGNWRSVANSIQGCGGNCYNDWDGAVARSRSLISKYTQGYQCGSSGSGSTSNAGAAVGESAANVGAGQKVGSQKTNSNGMINPIPGFTSFSFDKGVDACAQTGDAILAPAGCTYRAQYYVPNFYSGGTGGGEQPLLLFQFDSQPPGAPTNWWYVSEQITPTFDVTKDRHFNQGETVATYRAQGSCIEIGWGNPSAGDRRYAPVEDHYGQQHTGWGWDFYNYFSIGSGTPQKAGSTGSGAAGGGGAGSQDPFQIARATAFATELQWPTIADTIEAVALQGHKALMNDKPLLTFVQQVTQATLRSFQSAPNGDFYAFFPDYFGEFHHRDPYWRIDDVEVITGDIRLTDENLVTHMYVVGDTLPAEYPTAGITLIEKILSAGTVDIFDYFASNLLNKTQENIKVKESTGTNKSKSSASNIIGAGSKTGGFTETPLLSHSLHTQEGSLAFLQRYGARPVELDQPLIRSQFFEAFMAIQQFMLAWSMQFLTDFEFTFMPELYPGGRVQFGPPHNINMYIDNVTHTFDYEQGFTTRAGLSAPSAAFPGADNTAESPAWGMVNSISTRTVNSA